ncbi:hypothetical protein LPJ53_000022 [Coemansia erecta]|uniref:Kinase-like protein n=1 Tax=Coemansia erecta TaxID=147472 RepID=A0A9W7Y2L3_9FUNG|nr:hypothetical protein LPJ53_000022 [Coemansia erecta]
MSTGPSPLFVPLHPSPRLVAQMTGLSLEQSELEVSQQHNLKRMLRRIRASRQRAAPTSSPRGLRHLGTSIRKHMPSLTLPSAIIGDGKAGDRPAEDDSADWLDEGKGSNEDDGLLLRKMDIIMDISDAPSSDVLRERVADLFNRVFEPKPKIQAAHVDIRRLSGAMTNCVFMVAINPAPTVPSSSHHLSHVHKWTSSLRGKAGKPTSSHLLPTKYLLRVYGTGVDEFLSREKELYWLSQLTSLGFGPRMYGIFGNGRLEEFLESTTLTKDDIRDPSTSKHIARRMCELHSLVSYYRPYAGSTHQGRPADAATMFAHVDTSGHPELWTNVDSWMKLVQKKWPRILQVCRGNAQCVEILDNWTKVEQAVAKLRRLVDGSSSPVVFAHDDLQYGNILRLTSTGELVVVDFEYAGYNHRGFDIANHFCEWMADYHHEFRPHLLNEDMYPVKQQREGFLRTYVKAKAFLDANMKADAGVVESDEGRVVLREITLSDERIAEEIERLEKEVEVFIPASHFHWGVWGLLQACSSEIDFDYVGYATQRLAIFLRQIKSM